MEQIEIQDIDYLNVAKARAAEDPVMGLQVKCIALIRMLEAADQRYAELEEKYQLLLPKEDE